MITHSDILFSIPWECGESDCPQQWHRATYWGEFNGRRTMYTCDSYSDGDHDGVSKREIDSERRRHAKAWAEYRAWVSRTGEDPLNEFLVKAHTVGKVRARVRVRVSILGPVIVEAAYSRAKRKYVNVGVFDLLQGDPVLRQIGEWALAKQMHNHVVVDLAVREFMEVKPRMVNGLWTVSQEIELKIPRSIEDIRQELREKARAGG